MIYGIGTDIVQVSRIRDCLERFGERFARRILATVEWSRYERAAHPAHFLAKRFAAKEAAAKALGTGFRDGLGLRDFIIVSDVRGRPGLEFQGRARELHEELGIGECCVSISDEREYAVAFVTLMRR
ncbi:MAG: holo-ACP synthase [Xanthomonadaceae bacterium]|nr:holo-ACP synthase [Xanthomonadaceae bacterium]